MRRVVTRGRAVKDSAGRDFLMLIISMVIVGFTLRVLNGMFRMFLNMQSIVNYRQNRHLQQIDKTKTKANTTICE